MSEDERETEVQVNYDQALSDALAALQMMKTVPWQETLIVQLQPTEGSSNQVQAIDDDRERELVFTKMALEAAIEGCSRLDSMKVPFRRPEDYFAEMVKSDEHMRHVQTRLAEEKRRIDSSESAKREREMRKFGKQIQREKLKDRENTKKQAETAIKKWRKDHQAGDEFPVGLADEGDDEGAGPNNKKAKRGGGGGEEEYDEERALLGGGDSDDDKPSKRQTRKKELKKQKKEDRWKPKGKRSGWKVNNEKRDEEARADRFANKKKHFGGGGAKKFSRTLGNSLSGDMTKRAPAPNSKGGIRGDYRKKTSFVKRRH